MTVTADRSLTDRAMDVLRRCGNPFRNYFARNPDDDTCARYHVPELFARERDQLLGVVDLYRYDPTTHSEIVPILGNKGSGKTHLLHSIKHGEQAAWQLLVTPGTYQKDANFLEYLLFQVIDTLLGGGTQMGARPIQFVGAEISRRLMQRALGSLDAEQKMELFPSPGLGRWARKLGLGASQAEEKTGWLLDHLAKPLTGHGDRSSDGSHVSLNRICEECGLSPEAAFEIVCKHIEENQTHSTTGLMRRHIHQGFLRSVLLGDESELASFLTYGFAELEFNVEPSRQDLVLVLFKVIMEVFLELKIPVVVAFDQLEDLLLARRSDDCHRIAETFFAGIVQVMHQIDGVCFLVFAERGLWNRFVPSLDGYIQDRLNNPVHLPAYGTIKALRLEAPSAELLRRVVEARLRPSLQEAHDGDQLSSLFPFSEEQIIQVARTEPTLRDMLQQFRHLFDHLIYGDNDNEHDCPTNHDHLASQERLASHERLASQERKRLEHNEADHPDDLNHEQPQTDLVQPGIESYEYPEAIPDPSTNRAETSEGIGYHTPDFLSSAASDESAAVSASADQIRQFRELWDQELRTGRRKLEPEGSLTGATRELQAGLGSFLQLCHEHGVKVGPWRLQHVVGEYSFGEHPTYGVFTIAHWVCKDGAPWKTGVGLFLGRSGGKYKDLDIKLSSLEMTPSVIDHLILLRPEDDITLSGKSKKRWQEAEGKGNSARIEPVSLDVFAALIAFPRWLSAVGEDLPEGRPLPNLADFLQDRCERLLEQVCMPCP